jgi:hypothetical protein
VLEDLYDRTYVEILWPIELGACGGAVGLGNPGALQEFSSDNSRVSDLRLVNCDHVIRQAVTYDETAAFVFRLIGFLNGNDNIELNAMCRFRN